MNTVEFRQIDSQLSLKPSSSTDPWFFTNCSINPYRGCQFDCSYCDGKAYFYNIPNFGSLIRTKNNFARLLRKEFYRLGYESRSGKKQTSLDQYCVERVSQQQSRPKRFVLAVGGGVTDCYQPIEKEKESMRELIKVLIDFEIPSFFLTKSTLIARDLDLIGELHDICHASVNFSCAFHNDTDKIIHEPSSPSIKKRFETMEKFSNNGIDCGTLAMPLLPFIADSGETIEYLVKSAKDFGSQYILTAGLTLKPGNRELFIQKIQQHYPNLLSKYIELYPDNNTYGIPNSVPDMVNVTAKAHKIAKIYTIYPRVPRYIPDGCISDNYKLSEELWFIHYLKCWVLQEGSLSFDKEVLKATTNIDNFDESYKEMDELSLHQFVSQFSPYLQKIMLELIQKSKSEERLKLESRINEITF